MSDVAASPPATWGGVPLKIPDFVGREEVLSDLRTRLSTVQRPIVLTGMGGVGKSSVAVEYVYRHLDDYDGVWWVSSGSEEQIRRSLVDLAHRLGVGSDVKSVVQAVVDGVPKHRWLLVFDNATSPQLVAGENTERGARRGTDRRVDLT